MGRLFIQSTRLRPSINFNQIFIYSRRELLFSAFELSVTVSLAGDPRNTTYPFVTLNNAFKIQEEVLGFMLYITKVPYNNYWRSTTSVKLDANTTKYEFKSFKGNADYRITVVVIYNEKMKIGGYTHDFNSQETSKYVKNVFSPNENFRFITKKKFDQISVSSRKPQSFQCYSYNKTRILFAWLPPRGFAPDQNYTLHVLDEKGIEASYSVNGLQKWVLGFQGTWYHARVQAHYEKHDHEANYTTDYITCSTNISGKFIVLVFYVKIIYR